MGNAFNVSDNIGFDGYSYFCRRCGKAGYRKPTQVRGHLAMCAGTLLRKGASPTTSYNQLPTGGGAGLRNAAANQLQPLTGASSAGLGGSQLLQPLAVVGPLDNPLAASYQQLDRRVAGLENEYNHLLQQTNQSQQSKGSWITQHIELVILGCFALFALFMMSGQSQCPALAEGSVPGSSRKSKSSGFADFGPRLVGKAAERAMMKSVDKIFN